MLLGPGSVCRYSTTLVSSLLFDADPDALVPGDGHGSSIMDEDRQIIGLIAPTDPVAQPVGLELETILKGCAWREGFPPTPSP